MSLFEVPVLGRRMRGLYRLFTFLMFFKNFLFLRKTISSRVKHVQIVDAHGDMAWSLLKFRFFLTNVSHIGEVIARGSTPYRRRLAKTL